MNVGITAANLPTLKPLFASFFGHVRAITSGSNGRSTGISAPFKSSGYLKQSDAGLDSPAGTSFAMSNMSKGGRDADKSFGGSKHWKRGSVAGESDESILREHGGVGRMPSGRVIVRTTEVDIS